MFPKQAIGKLLALPLWGPQGKLQTQNIEKKIHIFAQCSQSTFDDLFYSFFNVNNNKFVIHLPAVIPFSIQDKSIFMWIRPGVLCKMNLLLNRKQQISNIFRSSKPSPCARPKGSLLVGHSTLIPRPQGLIFSLILWNMQELNGFSSNAS